MSDRDLFGECPVEAKAAKGADRTGPVRVVQANRHQATMRPEVLDQLLPADHRARDVWSLVERLELSGFYDRIEARGSTPGRPAIDPKILVALWVFATAEGVGSARALERLCQEHDAYRWICGGVSINHHTLSDFRVGRSEELDELLTQVLGVLMSEGVLGLRQVAQDGTRVRASAGAASFRRQRSLKKCLREAKKRVEALKDACESPAGSSPSRTRREAAQERAARERQERVERALQKMPEARAKKRADKQDDARVSTTDPEARVMKMADGGWRPAYNVQLAVDTESRLIVGVDVTDRGSDARELCPMLDQIERRTGRRPDEVLADGGFANVKTIEGAQQRGVTIYTPPTAPRQERDPNLPLPKDIPPIAEWRQRMGTETAKQIYKNRAATIETVNADLKAHRGLDRFRVRGLDKTLGVTLWAAITFNLLRWLVLAPPL
jgi:transposase